MHQIRVGLPLLCVSLCAAQHAAPGIPASQAASPGALETARRVFGADGDARQTDHFEIVFHRGTPPPDTCSVEFEGVYSAHLRFVRDLRLHIDMPPERLVVYYFPSYASMIAETRHWGVAPADALGFYDPAGRRSAFCDPTTHPEYEPVGAALASGSPASRPALQAEVERRTALLRAQTWRHELAHQIQHHLGLLPSFSDLPIWLTEGLAMLFESGGSGASACNLARAIEYRRLYADTPPTLADLQDLLCTDEAWCGRRWYPLAWAVTAELYQHRRRELAALLEACMRAGVPAEPSARRAWLECYLGPLDEVWRARVQALSGDCLRTVSSGAALSSGR